MRLKVKGRKIPLSSLQQMNIPINLVEVLLPIIIDDMVDTARTLIKASDLLLEEGALDVSAFVVHPILSKDAIKRVQDSNMEKLIVTDTIFHDDLDKKIISISITSLVANAIKKLHLEESLSDLY